MLLKKAQTIVKDIDVFLKTTPIRKVLPKCGDTNFKDEIKISNYSQEECDEVVEFIAEQFGLNVFNAMTDLPSLMQMALKFILDFPIKDAVIGKCNIVV